jgi:hypothetical protein
MREAALRHVFQDMLTERKEQPTVVQEEPVTPVSPRSVEDERLFALRVQDATSLRRRIETVPAAIAQRRGAHPGDSLSSAPEAIEVK